MKIRMLLVTLTLSLLLGACGGSALTQLANGGIGGTGISSGSITGFGSIFVNGVEYDVEQATFTRDGMVANGQGEYAVGEYVTVQGTVNADGVTGTASSVVYSNALKGAVTAVSTDATTLEVLGQSVRTHALTVFSGFSQLSDLLSGSMVEVSGIRDAQGVLVASNIRLLSKQYTDGDGLELKGVIRSLDTNQQRLVLGNLTVDYAKASLQGFPNGVPEVGQFIEVHSQQALQGKLMIASTLEYGKGSASFNSGDNVEIEGAITRFTSSSDFAVNGTDVTTQSSTVFDGGAASDLGLNALVEVEGTINAAGVLEAKTVDIRQSHTKELDEIEGRITELNTANKAFVLAGSVILTDTTTLWEDESDYAVHQMNFSQLNVGDLLEVKTRTIANGRLLALRVKRNNSEDD